MPWLRGVPRTYGAFLMTDFPSSPESSTLKLCPFCGKDDIERNSDKWGHWFFCDCGARSGYGHSPTEAAWLWNTRTSDHAPRLQVTDELVDRALTENVDLIQGYSYENYHCIRDFRQDDSGPEIWRCPRSQDAANHGIFQKRLSHEKLKAQLIAALSDTSTDREGK
jgi:ribosomal protein L37AE/L43A